MKKVLVLSLLCLVALFALQYCYTLSFSQPILQQPIPPDSFTEPRQTPDKSAFPWGTVLLSGLSAAIVTVIITSLISCYVKEEIKGTLVKY